MDTNINNYSTIELINLLKLSEEHCSLETVYSVIISSLQQINEKYIETNINDKKNILFFFKQCFYRICIDYKFFPTETMNQNIEIQLSMNDMAINSVVDNNITHNNSYIGSLPEKVPDAVTISSNNDEYARGLVNPLKRESIKNILVIHSKFRNDSNSTSTDFSVTLKEPFNNVVSLKMASMELMNSYYSISEYLKTNRFTFETYLINDSTKAITNLYKREIEIPEGSYTADILSLTINNICTADPSLNMITTKFYALNGRIIFSISTIASPPPGGNSYGFNLCFTISDDIDRPLFLNLGWLMGFTKRKYTFLNDYTAVASTTKMVGYNPDAPLDLTGTKFFLLEVNDYNNNSPAVLKYPIQDKYSFNIKDILAKIPNISSAFSVIFEDSSDRIFKSRKYFGPVKLQKLRIRLLDENGKVVNLNNSDMAISFEVESLDLPYKNMIK